MVCRGLTIFSEQGSGQGVREENLMNLLENRFNLW